jgi:pimeloyl-ACP methyl ester carboxylesterase
MPQKTFQADTGPGALGAWETGDGPPLLLLHGGPGLSDDMSMLGAGTAGCVATALAAIQGRAST